MSSQPTERSLEFDESITDPVHPVYQLFKRYGSDRSGLLVVGLLSSIIFPILSLAPIYLLQIGIDAVLLDEQQFVIPGFPRAWLPTSQRGQLVLVSSLLIGAALLAATLSVLATLAFGWFSQSVQHAIRLDTYRTVQHHQHRFFDDHQTGQVMSILHDDIENLTRLLEQLVKELVETSALLLGIAAMLLYLHWQLGLLALSIIPILALLSHQFVIRIRPVYTELRQHVGSLNARLENNLSGITTIKSLCAEEFEARRVEQASRELFAVRWRVILTQAGFFPSLSVMNWVGFSVMLLIGGVWYLDGPPWIFTKELTLGVLVAFLLYNQQLKTPIMQGSQLLDLYYESRASVVRILALESAGSPLPVPKNPVVLDEISGAIDLDSVSYRYPSAEQVTLHSVTTSIPAGAVVGVVGSTGAGKTTLVSLLLRFADPTTGRITIDGTDLRDCDPQNIREVIGFVSQEIYLFPGTIRENVAYPNREVSDRVIECALREAKAWSFVSTYPNGLDTTVGERGVKLSGGQRQRIAIARTLLANPQILILDEATSHVDTETEAAIQRTLQNADDRTTIAIAHRLSTVREADIILVLEQGRIIEQGRHQELLELDGRYAALWVAQSGPPPSPVVTPTQ